MNSTRSSPRGLCNNSSRLIALARHQTRPSPPPLGQSVPTAHAGAVGVGPLFLAVTAVGIVPGAVLLCEDIGFVDPAGLAATFVGIGLLSVWARAEAGKGELSPGSADRCLVSAGKMMPPGARVGDLERGDQRVECGDAFPIGPWSWR
jgi:hypothetical protein